MSAWKENNRRYQMKLTEKTMKEKSGNNRSNNSNTNIKYKERKNISKVKKKLKTICSEQVTV